MGKYEQYGCYDSERDLLLEVEKALRVIDHYRRIPSPEVFRREGAIPIHAVLEMLDEHRHREGKSETPVGAESTETP